MSNQSPYALPHLAEAFDLLRSGYHISRDDGNLYWALHDNIDAYVDLFKHLGFRLECHPRDFYYFHGEGDLSETSSRMALFVFILVEWLADRGENVEEAVMAAPFTIEDLPHLKSERYKAAMKEVGVMDQEGIVAILRTMERFGFVRRQGDRVFRFRTPAYRFFDLCLAVLASNGASEKREGAE